MSRNLPKKNYSEYLSQNSKMALPSWIASIQHLSIRKTTLLYLLNAFLLKIVLDLSSYFILPGTYAPFTLTVNLNLGKVVESYILLTVIVLTMPKNQQRISTLIIWLFLILSYIPELTLYSLSNEARTWIYGITGFWLLIFGCLWVKKKSFKTVRVKDAGLLIILFIALLLAYTLLVIFSVRGLAPTISFVDIYDNRALFGTVSLPLASYVTRWTALVINPFLLVFFLLRRNYLLVLAVIIFQFLLFALLGQKIFLFSIPFVIGLDWLIKKRKLTFSLLSFSLASVIFISSLSFIFLGDLWLSAIFTNRLLILPALISFNHYDFFSQHVPAYLGYSIFRSFVHYPYDLLPWFLIGDVYFGYPSVSANTGMIADAYMNFRFWGVFFLVPLFGITLCLIDKFTKIHNYRLVLALVIMPMFTLLAGGFLTSILTTGLGLALLLLHIIPGTLTADQQKWEGLE